jgi:23S rRNA (guanosine2251-2'-O)-methyltransferase
MPPETHQIRTCPACGLRYPHMQTNTFGTRCPACLGETRVTLRIRRKLEPVETVPKRSLPASDSATPKRPTREFAVLLDNIRSAWNVGSIFRSADGFGFVHAYLCGITPTPESEAVTKTSLGAENTVRWSYHKDAVKLVRILKKKGWQVWALEEHERAVPLSAGADIQFSSSVILIVGNEVTGVDPGLLALSDTIFHIPMRGGKKSFNVAIAFGIAAYQLT